MTLSDKEPFTTDNERYTRLNTKRARDAALRHGEDSQHWERGYREALEGEGALIPGDLHDKKEASELWLSGWTAGYKAKQMDKP